MIGVMEGEEALSHGNFTLFFSFHAGRADGRKIFLVRIITFSTRS
jgi:hypothetical protein